MSWPAPLSVPQAVRLKLVKAKIVRVSKFIFFNIVMLLFLFTLPTPSKENRSPPRRRKNVAPPP
jgi:hypothetical protein